MPQMPELTYLIAAFVAAGIAGCVAQMFDLF